MQVYRLPRGELLRYLSVPLLVTTAFFIWSAFAFFQQRVLGEFVVALILLGRLAWAWYSTLTPVFEIVVTGRDKIVFRSAIKRATLGPHEIASITSDARPRGVEAARARIRVQSPRGAVRVYARIARFEQFLEWIKTQNDAVVLMNTEAWTRSEIEPLFSLQARTYKVATRRLIPYGLEVLAIPFLGLLAIWAIRVGIEVAIPLALTVILDARGTSLLPVAYAVHVRSDGAIEFRTALRKTALWAREIDAIAADPVNDSFAEVRHQRGSARMMRSVEDFRGFLGRVKGLNRSITIWGLSVAECDRGKRAAAWNPRRGAP